MGVGVTVAMEYCLLSLVAGEMSTGHTAGVCLDCYPAQLLLLNQKVQTARSRGEVQVDSNLWGIGLEYTTRQNRFNTDLQHAIDCATMLERRRVKTQAAALTAHFVVVRG